MIRTQTAEVGHNSGEMPDVSGTVAAGQLRAFIERIERIEEEIKSLNGDKSEIYKEAKGVGFDVPTIRRIIQALKLDTVEREERDAIFDLYWSALTESEPDRARARAIARAVPNQNPPRADHVSPPARNRDEGSESANAGANDVDGIAERDGPKSKDGNASLAAREGEQVAAQISDDVPAFLKPKAPLRPHCLNRDNCAGVGHNHCYTCKKAMTAAGIEA